MAGRKPGGAKTGGRQAGTPNRATAIVRDLAQQHTPEAIEMLADLMRSARNEQARVAAIRELLDRGHGRPTQPLAGEEDGPIAITGIRVEFVGGPGDAAESQ